MEQLHKDLTSPRLPMGYLSGPMSAEDALTRNRHRFAALEASTLLWEAEVLHYCPHANSPIIGNSDVGYESWMAMDLEVIRRCDYLLMIDGWNNSPGCLREMNVALNLHLPVVYSVEAAIELDRQLKAKVA
ncbi:DUF4406 domain-containing protein [Geothrix sp. PMB-07]|uniref:DUF4406 domain-containing protein n=1 Tax=Geothrix sp. PMB-07 TaxID=3068640 RepID=UPI002740AA1F|nr:DUF4406 domain-containing protein [Geothrix sp. PMB-07]WLT32264.1 DUF4406 domain-containing protein [Geothrix sp. PMB-07]